MSLSTLRKNFYRISTLIIEHAADAMRILLHHFIQKNYKISFKAFVEKHQHELYHQFNIAICCQCPTSYRRPCKPIISSMQMETLFDNNCPKLPCHKHSSKCDYCCSTVKQDLKLKDIDITLLRFFLVTYFEEELWQDCLTDVVSFQEFLNKNKHDIFHLVQLKTKCCLCMENPNYTVMVGARKDKLTNHQWKTMFSAAPDQQCKYCVTSVDNNNPCFVHATQGIHPTQLDIRSRMIILSKFSTMMTHIDSIVNARNSIIAHAITGEISDENFRTMWNEIKSSIIYLSKITNTHFEKTRCILELREESLEEAMCFEIQCLVLRQKQGDELITQECRKLQQSIELLDASVADELHEIRLQIDSLTIELTNVKKKQSDNSENNLSVCQTVLTVFFMMLIPFDAILIVFCLTIGSVYINDCPAEKYIPIFLIVTCSLLIVLAIMTITTKEKKQKNKTWIYIIICFMVAWLIAGNVWIFRTFRNHSTADPAKTDYCNKLVYGVAFCLTNGINLIVAGYMYYVLASIIKYCRGTKGKMKDHGYPMP